MISPTPCHLRPEYVGSVEMLDFLFVHADVLMFS
jgi:hypothetical protein